MKKKKGLISLEKQRNGSIEDGKLPYLPSEIMEDILSRLPVESLLRFKRVSKSWCHLISSHQFAKMHLDSSSATPTKYERQKFITLCEGSPFCGNLATTDGQVRVVKIDYLGKIHFRKPYHTATISSSNGLCCLCIQSVSLEMFIFNPSIRESKQIPVPDYLLPKGVSFPLHGFGYCYTTDDYKIVKLCTEKYKWTGSYVTAHLRACQRKVYVYSLKNNTWKRVEDMPMDRIAHNHRPVVLNEAIHWLFYDPKLRDVIGAFDLVEEKFSKMEVPDTVGHLGVYGDALCFLSSSCLFTRNDIDGYVLWVLKEYGRTESWTKIRTRIPSYSLGFYSDDEIVNTWIGQKLELYNRRTGTRRYLQIFGSYGRRTGTRSHLQISGRPKLEVSKGCICTESLVSPSHYGVEEQGT